MNFKNKAISAVIGGVILFAMIFTVAFGYFYTLNQDQQVLQAAARQSASLQAQRNQENLYSLGSLVGGNLTFSVNNTGIATVLVGFVLTDQSGNILAQQNGGTATSAPLCSTKTATVPCSVNSGGSASFVTNIGYSSGDYYTMKVFTSRGTTVVGTYPTHTITSVSITSQIASGLGSLVMIFSSFTFYGYTTTSNICAAGYLCNINLSSAQPAAITPYGTTPIAFSVQITNNDPSAGTIVIDSHTDLWTFLSCGSGCGTQSLLGFYVMNVLANGTITSRTQNSFSPIMITYGATKTIYFGSGCDLSICSSYSPQSISDAIGEHDVFMIFSGALVSASNSSLYSQNLPYTATFASDNIAGFSETPTTCGNGSSIPSFSLTVTNSKWSPAGDGIDVVSVNASAFTNVQAPIAQSPIGWIPSVSSSGIITWTATNSAYYIMPSNSLKFIWSGTAPVVSTGTQYTFLSTAYWNSGTIKSQQIDTGCFVG
jgi:flagellin-like protein